MRPSTVELEIVAGRIEGSHEQATRGDSNRRTKLKRKKRGHRKEGVLRKHDPNLPLRLKTSGLARKGMSSSGATLYHKNRGKGRIGGRHRRGVDQTLFSWIEQ